MSFMVHIKELINRLRVIIIAVVISTIAVMLVPVTLDFSNVTATNPFYPTLTSATITNLQDMFLPADAELLPLSFLAPLEVYLFVAIILGVVISTPVISYEIYKFINPALHKHERKAILQFIIAFVGLFAFGFTLGYLFIVPMSMRMIFGLADMLGLPPRYAFSEFYSLVGFALLACGLILTLPAFLVLLVKAGILQTKTLTGNRKYLYGFLIVAIAILDPDPGLVTEALIFVPLVILTEISILIAKRIEKKRKESEDSNDS